MCFPALWTLNHFVHPLCNFSSQCLVRALEVLTWSWSRQDCVSDKTELDLRKGNTASALAKPMWARPKGQCLFTNCLLCLHLDEPLFTPVEQKKSKIAQVHHAVYWVSWKWVFKVTLFPNMSFNLEFWGSKGDLCQCGAASAAIWQSRA